MIYMYILQCSCIFHADITGSSTPRTIRHYCSSELLAAGAPPVHHINSDATLIFISLSHILLLGIFLHKIYLSRVREKDFSASMFFVFLITS